MQTHGYFCLHLGRNNSYFVGPYIRLKSDSRFLNPQREDSEETLLKSSTWHWNKERKVQYLELINLGWRNKLLSDKQNLCSSWL